MNNYFDNIFCINLDRRTDRRAQAEAEFKKHGITVEFVSGVDGLTLDVKPMISADAELVSRGDLGCTLSHLKVVKLAKERGYENYFVFEDDVELSEDFNEIIGRRMSQVPIDWDMIYLGGNHDQPLIPINDAVSKMTRTFTTHAMGIYKSAYDAMIEVWGKENDKVDIGLSSLHSKMNCYVFRPHLAFQRAGFSDILEKYDDYQHLRK